MNMSKTNHFDITKQSYVNTKIYPPKQNPLKRSRLARIEIKVETWPLNHPLAQGIGCHYEFQLEFCRRPRQASTNLGTISFEPSGPPCCQNRAKHPVRSRRLTLSLFYARSRSILSFILKLQIKSLERGDESQKIGSIKKNVSGTIFLQYNKSKSLYNPRAEIHIYTHARKYVLKPQKTYAPRTKLYQNRNK